MIELICGSAGSGKGAYIIEKIKETLPLKKKMFLLVPEQEAVIWEGRVCRALPASAGEHLQVVNFRRLADEVARQEGGLSRSYAGEAGRLLLMWSALLSVKEELKIYDANDGYEDKYAPLMLNAIAEMRRSRVTPAKLLFAGALLSNGKEESTLVKKLSDLALISAAYSEICEEKGFAVADDVLDGLAQKLKGSDFFKDSVVFIDSFFTLTPVETEILYYILRDASDIYITFNFDRDNNAIHFAHIKDFYNRVNDLLKNTGKKAKTVDLSDNLRTNNNALCYLEKNLWNFSAPAFDKDAEGVCVISCEDRYEEARVVGALIEKLVHGGAKYSDIAVVSGNMDNLRGIIDTHLESLGIPYHMSERKELKSAPAVRLIMSFLSAVRAGCRREDLVECLKTGLCPVSDRECSSFEEYTMTWNLHGRRVITSDEPWSMNPSGYKTRLDDVGRTVLQDANRVREVLAREIKKIGAVFNANEATVRDICTVLCHVLEDYHVWESLCRSAEVMRSAGRVTEAEIEEKTYPLILSAFDIMVETVGDVKIDAGRFSRLFYAVASSLDAGSIPSGVDMVTLGSAFGLRTNEVGHVILVGCIEGEFPSCSESDGFFSDVDKTELEKVGITLEDRAEKRMGEELFRFWRVMSMAKETLSVVIPRTDAGAACYPSIGAKRIMKLLSLEAELAEGFLKKNGVWSLRGATAVFSQLSFDAKRALEKKYPELVATERAAPLSADRDRLTEDALKLVYKDRVNLSQSKIDKYADCRFSYYMSKVMGLRETGRARVSFNDAGTFVHAILEKFLFETKDRVYPIDEAETEKIVDRITEEYISKTMEGITFSSRQKYLFVRLKRNALLFIRLIMDELVSSGFRPRWFELEIGGGEDTPPSMVFETEDGTKVTLSGTIDRVDTLTENGKVYVRVVDYKTGKKEFHLSDIEKGKNLQLMIYLFSLLNSKDGKFARELSPKGEKLTPGGMLYFSAVPDGATSKAPVTAEEAELLAKDSVNITGMMLDEVYEQEKTSGKGRPRINSGSIEDFEKIYERIEKIIVAIVNAMKRGDCSSIPAETGLYNSSCKFCKMKPICRHIEKKEAGSDE